MELEYFNKFMNKDSEKEQQNNVVWTYTRVSSKDQEMNKSLGYQKEYAENYAKKNNLKIADCFGETYESAKGDFTRKEFTKLITKVKKAKKKPFAIMIYKMNRFSRSGGKGIAVANELVHNYGVHLIEVSSGITTSTEEGEYQIWQKLLRARKENMERLEHTLPGLRRFVEDGNYLGKAPLGYDLHGTKVKDFSKRATEQKMVINEEGKLLKKAWKMKVNGERDYIIRTYLEKHGLKVYKQKMSAMWKKATYCGISTNKFLKKPIKGNWKPIVSIENFRKVQYILSNNKNGYQIEKKNSDRPLIGFIFCSKCERKLTGYANELKGLHYYKCQKCKGTSINANTTKKSLKVGAHNMFTELLSSYKLDSKLIEPFKAQLKLTFQNIHKEEFELQKSLNKRIKNIEIKIDELANKLIDGVINDDIYKRKNGELETKLSELKRELDFDNKKISNLDNFVDSIVDVSQNISINWGSGGYEVKRKIQELVFPYGLVLDAEKRQYLTKKVNYLFEIISSITRDTEDIKNKKVTISDDLSCLVAGKIIKSNLLISDSVKILTLIGIKNH